MNRCEVVVVGAGPIGLETAAVLQGEGRDVLVVDAGAVGATILRTFPPNTRFFTSPERLAIRGQQISSVTGEKATGEEYLAFLRTFVAANELRVRTYNRVIRMEGQRGRFTLTLHDSSHGEWQLHAEAVVLATGGTDRPRRLGVPGEDLPHVFTYLGDPHRYFGRRVLVVGGRNSAAEAALRLYRVGARALLAHRGPELHTCVKHWIRPEVAMLLAEGEITGHLGMVVTRIDPGLVTLAPVDDAVRNAGGESPKRTQVQIDDVLLQIGFEQDQTIFDLAGVATGGPNRAPRIDELTMESNIAGVYVVGTASAGTQAGFSVFIENSHQHADRVVAALAGRRPPTPRPPRPLPES